MSGIQEAERAPRRRWPIAEKRRIVELTLRPGASVGAIAREHGVHPTSVCHWRARYRCGTLDAHVSQGRRVRARAPVEGFFPVTIEAASAVQSARERNREVSTVHIALPSGVSVRIETNTLDVGVLLGQLR